MNAHLRDLVQENHVRIDDFIYPLFIIEGENIKKEVVFMPGIFQMSIDVAIKECQELKALGINAILLFGIPNTKDSIGSDALCENGIIATAIKEIKKADSDMFIITDLCFCEYTDHGHCGVINPHTQQVDNCATLELSAKQAIIHAKAGANMIANSGMMDEIVITLRKALDENEYKELPIMSYSTKFASSYYGPFRQAVECSPSFGDRRTYQMNPANGKEALRESLYDEKEGADILMVKPALAYLDVVKDISNNSSLPIAVYNVSGEYAMFKHAQMAKIIDYDHLLMETMLSFKRAGASIIISYHAKEVAKILNK